MNREKFVANKGVILVNGDDIGNPDVVELSPAKMERYISASKELISSYKK